MPSTTLTIDQLAISPHNVRRNQANATNTEVLEASILSKGVEQQLLVHPMDGSPGVWGVYAGGRRYRSVRNLVDRGDLPADFAVPVDIDDTSSDADIVAKSLDENMQRLDLLPYETFAAIALEHALGHSIEEIARGHGQQIAVVEQAVRLGNLAQPVFAALEAGRISTEQAKAFGATADHELQLAAFEAKMAGPEHERTPAAIRAWLRIDDREAGRLLRFVGRDAYRQAGGFVERDLFSDGEDESGRITNLPLLDRLADEKIAAIKARVRADAGRPELRFVPQPPQGAYGGHDYILLVQPTPALPAGDIVAAIELADDGTHEVTFWWASRKAMEAARKPAAKKDAPAERVSRSAGSLRAGSAIGQQYDDSRMKADALIKEETGITRESIDILRSIRRSILRAALVQDAREGRVLARDYLVWAQLRMLLSTAGTYGHAESYAEVGMTALHTTEVDPEPARALIAATEAGKVWQKAIRDLQSQSFLTERDLAAAFLDFRNAPQAMRDLAAAVVAGIALVRSLAADAYEVAVHDALAVQARAAHPQGLRHWWQPSAAFLKLLPRTEQLAIAEPFVEGATFGGWSRLKVDELIPLVLKVVTGTAPSLRKRLAITAGQWVHPLLRFRHDAGVRPPEPDEAQLHIEDAIAVQEAAE